MARKLLKPPVESMKLTFFGATETVTGSRFLVEAGSTRILVDCGLFQGLKPLRLRNWDPFPVAPDSLTAVILTHAHIDHSGYLPRLCNQGFDGPVYATRGTAGLCRILLPDAGHLQEEEARYASKRRYSKHRPALPLYTAEDGARSLERFRAVEWDTAVRVGPLEVRFSPAGHILGAASVIVSDGARTLAFSGDVGRPNDPVMRAPRPLPAADYVVVESTYGNRRHPTDDPLEQLVEVVNRTIGRGGTLIVPAFAVGRTQTLLHLLHVARAGGRIPAVPVYLNSPMAISATRLLCDLHEEHRLTDAQCAELEDGVHYVTTVEQSKALNDRDDPKIIISASGMATGGRVIHHLARFAPDERNTILLSGYQAAGTRGEAMLSGAGEIKIHGQYVPVRAEVAHIDTLSAHADALELIEWLRAMPSRPARAFIVHGEPAAQDALRRLLRDRLDWDATIPAFQEGFDL